MLATSVSQYIDVSALIKILLIAVVAGAGLTAVFSLGILGLHLSGRDGDRDGQPAATANGGGLVLAVLCFLLVLAGIGYGISVAITK